MQAASWSGTGRVTNCHDENGRVGGPVDDPIRALQQFTVATALIFADPAAECRMEGNRLNPPQHPDCQPAGFHG